MIAWVIWLVVRHYSQMFKMVARQLLGCADVVIMRVTRLLLGGC